VGSRGGGRERWKYTWPGCGQVYLGELDSF
jgi:hypothetical protein